MIDRLVGVLAPREWPVVLDEHSRRMHVVDVVALEAVDNHHARVVLVFGHLAGCHVVGAGDGVMEIVGMSGTDVGNVETGLRPRRGVGGVGVYHAAYLGKLTVEHQVGGRVGRGFEVALHHLAGVQVDHHHVVGLHVVVAHTRRFDDNEALLAVDARDIAPCEYDEMVFHKVEIGLEHLLFQFF